MRPHHARKSSFVCLFVGESSGRCVRDGFARHPFSVSAVHTFPQRPFHLARLPPSAGVVEVRVVTAQSNIRCVQQSCLWERPALTRASDPIAALPLGDNGQSNSSRARPRQCRPKPTLADGRISGGFGRIVCAARPSGFGVMQSILTAGFRGIAIRRWPNCCLWTAQSPSLGTTNR